MPPPAHLLLLLLLLPRPLLRRLRRRPKPPPARLLLPRLPQVNQPRLRWPGRPPHREAAPVWSGSTHRAMSITALGPSITARPRQAHTCLSPRPRPKAPTQMRANLVVNGITHRRTVRKSALQPHQVCRAFIVSGPRPLYVTDTITILGVTLPCRSRSSPNPSLHGCSLAQDFPSPEKPGKTACCHPQNFSWILAS
jgi:hypothetical protein